jgi:hypothetical protein
MSTSAVPVRIQLDVTGLAGTTVTIIRSDANGNSAPVRSADPAPLSGGEWVGYDYEAPFGVQVWYTATSDTGAVDTAGPLVLDVASPWLIHPGIPLLSQPVTIKSKGDRTSTTNVGTHVVLGRENPVIITDGVRHGSAFPMVLGTDTADQADALRTLLADAQVLLLQVTYEWTERREYLWISIGNVVEHDLTDDYDERSIRWSMDCTVTDAPFGTLQAEWTWQDLVDGYPTWQDVLDAFPTWRDVVTNSPSS